MTSRATVAGGCRRDTRCWACENIVAYGERSFALVAGRLLWTGRWARFETASRAEPRRGELALAVRDARPWRLADPAVVLTDAVGGRRETLRFAQFHVDFDDSLALDAPMQAVPAAASVPTRLHLEALLPDGLPAFELRLSPLQMGAERVEIDPITSFERRSLDGGIEPFNC